MMTHVIDKLYNFSANLDSYFGAAHTFARSYREMCMQAGPALNGLMSYYDSGRQALQIALRFLYAVQQLVFQWIRRRLQQSDRATRIPAPDFDALVECLLTFMVNTLPHLPASWERLIVDNADERAALRLRGGGGGGGDRDTTVHPRRHPPEIRRRWRDSGFQRTSQLTRGWTGEGNARDHIPRFDDGVQACLNWACKGVCDRDCPREGAHRESNTAMVNDLMEFMTMCGVART